MTVMAIEQVPSQRPGPGGDREDRSLEAVRVFPADVVPGTVGTGLEDHDEDLAPGLIHYYTPRPSKLARTGSAAMVAATYTARGAGVTARHSWKMIRWFAHGVRSATFLGYRYVRAHDHQEVIGGRKNGTDWNKVERTKRERWMLLGKVAAGTILADIASWWALVGWGHMTALGGSYAVAPSVEAIGVVTALTLYGRYRMTNQLAPEQVVAPEDVDDGEEPFPLAYCRTGRDVEECVGRALAYEGVGTRQVGILGARPWGWEVDVTLKNSTPGKVIAVADQLDAHFDVKHGGTLIEPDKRRAAHLTLRLVTDDPFKNMPAPAVYGPNSLDIADLQRYGISMDGQPLQFVLEGTRIIVIGVSGAAKSTGVLRNLAYTVTACHNAIALDLDPVKDGLREFEGVMAAPPIRGNDECEKWLDYLVKMAEARNVVRNRLNMGDTWDATSEHPDIVVFVDEFIYLSKKAKESFIRLLRLGKQSGIFPVAAGQDATSDSMGDAIADSFTLQIMLASRHADIPLVLGTGAISQGFRPDRLVPAQNEHIANDAGQSYIKGAGMERPILYGWDKRSRQSVKDAVAERMAAGRPWFDDDTLAEAGLLDVLAEYRPAAKKLTVIERLERIGSDKATAVAAMLRQFDEYRTRFLPTAVLVATGAAADGAALQKLLSELVPTAKSTKDYVDGQQVRGWARETVEQAAAALFAPS
jgi:S-DNA-T family DNA segregation ATPase FtsK/SpoIIIE